MKHMWKRLTALLLVLLLAATAFAFAEEPENVTAAMDGEAGDIEILDDALSLDDVLLDLEDGLIDGLELEEPALLSTEAMELPDGEALGIDQNAADGDFSDNGRSTIVYYDEHGGTHLLQDDDYATLRDENGGELSEPIYVTGDGSGRGLQLTRDVILVIDGNYTCHRIDLNNNSLTIYGARDGGTLTVDGGGIYGCGKLTLCSGTVDTTSVSANYAAFGCTSNPLYIKGGKLTARVACWAQYPSAIGCPDDWIHIEGGEVTAISENSYGAAIGGFDKKDGRVEITGGHVTALLTYKDAIAAAIGGGAEGAGYVNISGGVVEARTDGKHVRAEGGAAIGGGNYGSADINITGGSVHAYSAPFGAAIGGGNGSKGVLINIAGGTIVADGVSDCVGIGGIECRVKMISIQGGNITAIGHSYGPGIGVDVHGYSRLDYLKITGGIITATAGDKAPAIGGYFPDTVGKIAIYAGTVRASSEWGVGIGGGPTILSWSSWGHMPVPTKPRITVQSFNGEVTLERPFKDAETGRVYEASTLSDEEKESIKNRTLIPSGSTERTAKPDMTLLAKMKTSGKKALMLCWTKVKDAQGYDVFFKRRGASGDYTVKKVSGGKTLNCTIKGLKKGKTYKGYVKAWKKVNGTKEYIGKASPTVYAIVGGYSDKWCNAKCVTVKKSELTLSKGKTKRIKAGVKGVKSGRKVLKHGSLLRYFSSDCNIATVNGEGVVKGVAKGACTIYVMASNGLRQSVQIHVK